MKVLSIGNIANNAYLNAKILKHRGVECDVMSANYYHEMGLPPWEDDLSLLQYKTTPQLLRLHTKNPKPVWPAFFTPGPLLFALCSLLWNDKRGKIFRKITTRYTECFLSKAYTRINVFERIFHSFNIAILNLFRRVLGVFFRIPQNIYIMPQDFAQDRRRIQLKKRLSRKIISSLQPLVRIFFPPPSRWRSAYLLQLAQTKENYDEAFAFAHTYYWLTNLMPKVFDRYDIVIGYAMDGCWPLATGKRPYCAFEHGTIRSIPFEDNWQGNLCQATYRNADYVFITNCDNITAAKRLGLQNFCFLPHPINEDIPDYIDPEELRKRLNALRPADFWIFHPSRQHWDEERHPSWEKGNDRLIYGMAEAINKHGCKLGAVFVDWGRDVAKSKDLLEKLGIAEYVVWIDPMPHPLMVEYLLATDCCADQFHLGAFGSTAPKALYHKRPVLIYLDEERHRWCLPEMPPMINVKEPENIAVALAKLCRDEAYRLQVGEEGRRWYDACHSNKVIGDILERVLADVYKKRRETA